MNVPLALPPGVFRPGTVYQAKGRWYDTNLMRWRDGALQPIGGWSELIPAASLGSVPVRTMLSWRINSGISRIMLGQYHKAWVYDAETAPMSPSLTDITPTSGFTPGGFDDGGLAWQMDNFGEDVVAVLPLTSLGGDGNLWLYDASAATSPMTIPSGAPTPAVARGVVVTPERFVFLLGAGGDPRKVQWADQESLSVWTPTATNQAGDHILQSKGVILAGRRSRKETLIWTDEDLWAARYIGGDFIYSFVQVGSQCGPISAQAMAMVDGKAIWMGRNGFFAYDGFVSPIPSEVADFIFGLQPLGAGLVNPPGAGIYRPLAAWVRCYANTQFNEVTWHYPSQGANGTATENDRYVTYNYLHGHWAIGALARTAGVEDGGSAQFGRPVLAAPTGAIYRHEGSGIEASDWGGVTPYAESGPVELGEGDRVFMARQYIPDGRTLGQWRTTIYSSFHPTAAEVTHGPYTSANPTDVRLTGRQVRIKVEAVDGTVVHRFGNPRLEVEPGGLR